MRKPKNFENTRGNFSRVELGGHHAIVRKAKEAVSKYGQPMVVVALDFADGDRQAGYFANEFRYDLREDRKWPNQGTKYITSEDAEGNCTRWFKAFVTAVEKSNDGLQLPFDETFCDVLKGKKVGVVFGESENEYEGRVTMRREIRYFCDDAKVDEQPVPKPKMLKKSSGGDSEFHVRFEEIDADVPF